MPTANALVGREDGHMRVGVPDEALALALRASCGDRADFVVWSVDDAPPDQPFALLVLPYMDAAAVGRLSPRVSPVLQSQSLGFDGVAGLLQPGLTYCNAVGVHEGSTAELALALILADRRGLPAFVHGQRTHRWVSRPQPGLAGSQLLLVGSGGVGNTLARMLVPFEVEIVRIARSSRDDELGPVHSVARLPELLPEADVVVIATPLTDDTRGLVSDDFLGAMKDGALLINVARGPVVDTAALLRQVTTGRLHAGLDVVDPEPLPADHPLWDAPNVTLTPHVGGRVTTMSARVRRLVEDQVNRLAAGQEPAHIVLRT
ncbi:MAG: hypothetical protein JO147_03970 [Actinobacteria bacterium]|nr:hypothetical protein [Actinomycetota bacterium]